MSAKLLLTPSDHNLLCDGGTGTRSLLCRTSCNTGRITHYTAPRYWISNSAWACFGTLGILLATVDSLSLDWRQHHGCGSQNRNQHRPLQAFAFLVCCKARPCQALDLSQGYSKSFRGTPSTKVSVTTVTPRAGVTSGSIYRLPSNGVAREASNQSVAKDLPPCCTPRALAGENEVLLEVADRLATE